MLFDFSNTVGVAPSAFTRIAAARPEMPPPMMATFTGRVYQTIERSLRERGELAPGLGRPSRQA